MRAERGALLLSIVAVLCLAVSAPAAAADPPPGFASLFNGRDLSGWKVPAGDNGHWKVDGGVIDYDAASEATGDKALWTAEGVRRLRAAARLAHQGDAVREPERADHPASTARTRRGPTARRSSLSVPDSDSGIYLRGSSKSQVNIWCWPIGSGEVYGYRTDDKMPPEVRAGVTPRANADKDVGEWNAFEITMKGDRLTVVLNGEHGARQRAAPRHPGQGPARAAAPRRQEGRRLDEPAVPRSVPEHLDQGAPLARVRGALSPP